MKSKGKLILLFLILSFKLNAQNLSLADCEKEFLSNNLVLLAERYNIDANKAYEIQAGLWENPYLSAELNLYNPNKSTYFNAGKNGQKAFAISQIIHIANQKQKGKNIAQTSTKISEFQFEDLLRNLKFELRTAYFAIYFDRQSLKTIDLQINNIEKLIQAFQVQVKNGNIPEKDVIRLQSLNINLKNDKIIKTNDLLENEQKLKVLINSESELNLAPNESELLKYWQDKSLVRDSLISIALRSRNDLLAIEKEQELAKLNVKLQKSLAIPDLNIGASYDQMGGAFPNQTNLTLGIPLVLWNRNQGNIKAAKIENEQAKKRYEAAVISIKNEVASSYEKYLNTESLYLQTDPSINTKFDEIYQSMLKNFQKSNISIIEFTDFMESYNQSIIQLNELKKSLINACEEINYVSSSNIF